MRMPFLNLNRNLIKDTGSRFFCGRIQSYGLISPITPFPFTPRRRKRADWF